MTGEIHHVDAGYNVVGMKAEDAPDIAPSDGRSPGTSASPVECQGVFFRAWTREQAERSA